MRHEWTRRLGVTAWLVASLMGGAAHAAAAQDPGGGPVRLTPTVFRDPAAGDVAALTLLVPAGWQATGGVQWLPTWSRLAHLATHVTDPDTGVSIDWLPIQDFMWFAVPAGFDVPIGGNYQGKAIVPPITDPAEFVSRFWVPSVLPHLADATLVGLREDPRVAQELLTGFGGPGEAGAWTLRYAFDRDGQPWEQDVSFALLWAQANGVTSWHVNFAYAVAGPPGSIDANQGLISTVVASRATTPEWEATFRLVQQLFYRGIQQQMADTVAFGQALAQYRAEIQALQQQVTAERQASQDRIAEYRRDILGGVDNYDDPVNGGIVQLPVGWSEYWVNPQGEYLIVGDPNFDPSSVDNAGWQRLRRHEG
jgi:hypothetical protein